ncbi:hypothetical protein SNE26_20425 [Mucilaginibacter sp. cycad4]|nr:hypothetical protein [Mucilaginibacter gossypii]WPU98395.1 hypothetical protein SNE26_20425 [Mucilaginibacter gossypii]
MSRKKNIKSINVEKSNTGMLIHKYQAGITVNMSGLCFDRLPALIFT